MLIARAGCGPFSTGQQPPARAARPPSPSAKPQWQLPGGGVDFGQITRMEAELGHRAGLVHWFAGWDEGWDT